MRQRQVSMDAQNAKRILGKMIALALGIRNIKSVASLAGVDKRSLSRMVIGAGSFERSEVLAVLGQLPEEKSLDSEVVQNLLATIHSPAKTCPRRFRRRNTIKRPAGRF